MKVALFRTAPVIALALPLASCATAGYTPSDWVRAWKEAGCQTATVTVGGSTEGETGKVEVRADCRPATQLADVTVPEEPPQ